MAKKKEPVDDVRHWLDEISSAKKREKDFRKDGEEVVDIYSGKKADQIPFNILFSNTETLLPAIFSQTPRPVVQRRFKDEDPLGKAASQAAQRMLEFLCDTNVEGYETFDESMSNTVLDALLPGRGITSIKYEADITDGEIPVVKWEQVCTDSRGWDKVYFGFARKWSKVPWIAYEEYLDKTEAEQLFGKEIAKDITFTANEEDEDDDERTGVKDGGESKRKTALIYQIWDKSDKTIKYVSPQYPDGILKQEDDPLGITGFFNCPRPLQFLKKSNDLLPVALYKLYENQAKELNRITRRLNKVVEAVKVRGVYDGALGSEIENILKEDDNGLVPTDKGASLAAEGGLEKAIWFMPIEKLVAVAQNLVQAREQCKQVIYEITGVSDILRGQSTASETLGAQKIKESWGTMRLKNMQRSVQRYARDILRIMIDVAAAKFSERTWAMATGLPFATSEQKAQAQQMMQIIQAQGQQPDPQTVQIMQSPSWGDVLKLLKDDGQRGFRIDIETNSTVDVEATEDQKNVGDFMNAMGQLMAGLTPMVESQAMPFEAAQSILLAVIRRFRFGTEVEDQFKNMKPPQPKDDGKGAEIQAKQAEMQQKAEEGKIKLQIEQAKAQTEQARAALDMQKMELEMELATKEHQLKMQELVAKAEYNVLMAQVNEKKLRDKAQGK